MNQSKVSSKILRDALLGLALLVGMLLIPDQTHGSLLVSLQVALNSPWARYLDWPAAWCSLKLLVVAIGFYLIAEAAGTCFAKWRLYRLASFFYLSVLLPCALLAFGFFLLLKALL